MSIIKLSLLGAIITSSLLVLGVMGGSVFATGNQIEITEFMANPKVVTDANGEWVEIINNSPDSVTLENWDIDGSTINPSLIIEPGQSKVICRNLDETQNGGVICDAKSSYSLGNTSDSILLRNENNQVVSRMEYFDGQVIEGSSSEKHGEDLLSNSSHQYGNGDFGTPANNQFGVIIVHSIEETNNDEYPNFLGGETLSKNWEVKLFKLAENHWEERNVTETTGFNFPNSAMFITSPGEYAVCLTVPEDHYDTFAKKSLTYFVFEDTQIGNGSKNPKSNLCSKVSIDSNEYENHYLGAKKKFEQGTAIRVHVMNDDNNNGYPDFGLENLIAGRKVNVYSSQDWEDAESNTPTQSTYTTGLPYSESAILHIDSPSDYWVVCVEISENENTTFAREIASWTTYPDRSVPNTKLGVDHGLNCAKTSIHDGQLKSVVLGIH